MIINNMDEKFTLSEDLVYGDTETFVSLLKFELMRITDIKNIDEKESALLNVIEELHKIN